MRTRRVLAALTPLLLVGAGFSIWASTSSTTDKDKEPLMGNPPVRGNQLSSASDVTSEELARVARTRVFFGHQSVGMNVLDGVPGVYKGDGRVAPPIVQNGTNPGPTGGFIAHAFVGSNENPVLKIDDFDAKIRGGIGRQIDVALMKLCYIDITRGTDVDALFAKYRDTMAALERDFPEVTFVKVTVPLTTERGSLSTLRSRLRGDDRLGPAENVQRERLNGLIRREYADDHLFDLAAIESTAPDGTRVSGTYNGHPYFALHDGYASDSGHLDAGGSRTVASRWLKAIAQASRK